MYSEETKRKAIELRKQGKSLLEISQILHTAKSTSSLWLSSEKNRGIYGTMSKQEWMRFIQKKSIIALNKRTLFRQENRVSEAKHQISGLKLPLETKRAILATIYWAEGSKGQGVLDFASTDPKLCLIFTTLYENAMN